MSDLCAVRAFVSGRVQGVWFRDSTRRMALGLGLDGWVRNLPDGRVEALFQGPAAAVAQALAWCREGPPLARVDDVSEAEEAPMSDLAGFDIR